MPQERERIAAVWFYGTLAYCLVVAVAAGLSDAHHSGDGMMPPLIRVFLPLRCCHSEHRPFTPAKSAVGGVPPLPGTSIRSHFGLVSLRLWRWAATFYFPALDSGLPKVQSRGASPNLIVRIEGRQCWCF
jgi:hypothetical protein